MILECLILMQKYFEHYHFLSEPLKLNFLDMTEKNINTTFIIFQMRM